MVFTLKLIFLIIILFGSSFSEYYLLDNYKLKERQSINIAGNIIIAKAVNVAIGDTTGGCQILKGGKVTFQVIRPDSDPPAIAEYNLTEGQGIVLYAYDPDKSYAGNGRVGQFVLTAYDVYGRFSDICKQSEAEVTLTVDFDELELNFCSIRNTSRFYGYTEIGTLNTSLTSLGDIDITRNKPIKTFRDYCADIGTIIENTCNGGSGSLQPSRAFNIFNCPAGQTCNNGKCAVSPQLFCIDTDNETITVNGITRSGIINETNGKEIEVAEEYDECLSSSIVKEYSCDATNRTITVQHQCPSGMICSRGRCLVLSDNNSLYCLKSDPRTVEWGIKTNNDNKIETNSRITKCLTNTTLKSYFCEGKASKFDIIKCNPNERCLEGVCIADSISLNSEEKINDLRSTAETSIKEATIAVQSSREVNNKHNAQLKLSLAEDSLRNGYYKDAIVLAEEAKKLVSGLEEKKISVLDQNTLIIGVIILVIFVVLLYYAFRNKSSQYHSR